MTTPIENQAPSGGHSTPSGETAGGLSARTAGPSLAGSLHSSDRELLLHGRRAFERGEDRIAFESLSRLAQHGNLYADVHYMLGILLDRKGQRREAIESLRRATRTNPSYVEALLALASLHETEGDFDLSESYAERASQLSRSVSGQLDPTTRGKLANQQAVLADALLEAGERREAIAQYRQALDRCPNFHDIRHRLGIALRESGLPFQAAQEFKRILGVHTGMLESQIQLGVTYYSLGRTPEAITQWEAVLERDPSRDEARMYLRLVNSGTFTRDAPLAPSNRGTDFGTQSGWSTRPLDALEIETDILVGAGGEAGGEAEEPAPLRRFGALSIEDGKP